MLQRLTSAALAALACAMPAAAVELPLWELGIGAAALRLPHYRGSDQSRSWLLPLPYVVYRGEIFRADREGARAVLIETRTLEFDLNVAATAPTRSTDNRARRGMSDLAPTIEAGPNLNLTLARSERWKLDLRVPVRAVATVESNPRWIGWTATPHLNLDIRAPRDWNLGLRVGPVYGSRRLHGYFYDVAPADATAARPSFQAAGGAGGAQALAALSRLSGNLWTGMFLSVDNLAGAHFIDSPLVRRRDHVSFGIAMAWVFARSSQRVNAAQ